MASDDVFQVQTQSGGGYGDPLERDPPRVLADVESGVVTVEGAREMYGVVIAAFEIEEAATVALRDAIRARRRQRARPVGELTGTGLQHVAEWEAASAGPSW
jgi:N-methylhydantoinase B